MPIIQHLETAGQNKGNGSSFFLRHGYCQLQNYSDFFRLGTRKYAKEIGQETAIKSKFK